MSPIRLLIVDDHPVMRDGLRGVFAGDTAFEVVGEAGDGAEAVRQAQRTDIDIDVVLMDLRMPGTGGVEAILRLRELRHPARVLVLTTFDTDRDVLPAVEAGATGYLLKDAPREELIRAVRAAHAGQPVLSPSVAGTLMGRLGVREPGSLSPRELDVLRLMTRGMANRQIGAALFPDGLARTGPSGMLLPGKLTIRRAHRPSCCGSPRRAFARPPRRASRPGRR